MKITLSPTASTYTSTISLDGLVLTIDGKQYDLSQIPKGGQAESDPEDPFIGIITRESCTILYHYDSSKAIPNQSTNWDHYTFEVISGNVPCPIIWKEEQDV
jgi:hypothetical protein